MEIVSGGGNLTPAKRLIMMSESKTIYYDSGIENVAWISGYTSGTGDLNKNSDHLYLYAANTNSNRTYVTEVAVNLTNIKTLYIDWENTGSTDGSNISRFNVSTSRDSGTATYNTRLSPAGGQFGRNVSSLDVSSLTGEYYIRVHATTLMEMSISEIKVYRIWGE
jgi:hypothetical protein